MGTEARVFGGDGGNDRCDSKGLACEPLLGYACKLWIYVVFNLIYRMVQCRLRWTRYFFMWYGYYRARTIFV